MQRKWILIIGIVLIALGVGVFLLRSKLKPAQAGIQIDTNPDSSVYINDEQVGTTPYDSVRTPGEITVRLIPQASDKNLTTWGTKLTLAPGIKTVVRRDFGETEDASAGEVLSFEKLSGNDTALVVVSSPDSAQVLVDGDARGFTPISLDSIEIGEHKLVISQTGFVNREVAARAESGYKLTVIAKLAQVPQAPSQDATPSGQEDLSILPAPSPKGKVKSSGTVNSDYVVKILDTPTGFLRVRKDASSASEEVGRVDPGKEYPYIDEKSGWLQIEYIKGKQGWVSSQYAKKTAK